MRSLMKSMRVGMSTALFFGGLAGYTTQVSAQSNITMYGNLDTAIGKSTGSAVTMGPGYFNWLGIKGNEQLSGDLKTIFNLQMRFSPDTGALSNPGTFWQGESTVGLQSASFGTIRMGRAMTPMWNSLWLFEPWANGATFATLSGYQTGSYSSDGVSDVAQNYATFARINNGVFYDSPSWSGVHFSVAGEAELAQNATARNKGMSLNYDGKGLTAMLSYETNHESDSIAYAGVTYVLGDLKLFGSYARTHVKSMKAENLYLLAATYALTSSDTLRTGYGGNDGLKSHKVSLGYVHALSKRTSLYTDVWDEKTTTGVKGYVVGMSHSF